MTAASPIRSARIVSRSPFATCLAVGLLFGAVLGAVSLSPRVCRAEAEHVNADATKHARRLYEQGVVLMKQGEHERAIDAFVRGYEQKPQALFLYNIAQLHAWQGRPANALDYYERFVTAAPNAPERGEVDAKIRLLKAAMAPTPTPVAQPAIELAPTTVAVTRPPKKKHTGLWIAIGVIGGAVVVAGVTLGVVLGTRSSSPPTTALGNLAF